VVYSDSRKSRHYNNNNNNGRADNYDNNGRADYDYDNGRADYDYDNDDDHNGCSDCYCFQSLDWDMGHYYP
jgi:hypothetical protein